MADPVDEVVLCAFKLFHLMDTISKAEKVREEPDRIRLFEELKRVRKDLREASSALKLRIRGRDTSKDVL